MLSKQRNNGVEPRVCGALMQCNNHLLINLWFLSENTIKFKHIIHAYMIKWYMFCFADLWKSTLLAVFPYWETGGGAQLRFHWYCCFQIFHLYLSDIRTIMWFERSGWAYCIATQYCYDIKLNENIWSRAFARSIMCFHLMHMQEIRQQNIYYAVANPY